MARPKESGGLFTMLAMLFFAGLMGGIAGVLLLIFAMRSGLLFLAMSRSIIVILFPLFFLSGAALFVYWGWKFWQQARED